MRTLHALVTRPAPKGPRTRQLREIIPLGSPEWLGASDTLTITMPAELGSFGAVIDGMRVGRVLVTGLVIEAVEEPTS